MVKGLLEYLLAGALMAVFLFVVWYVMMCSTGYSALEMCRA